MDLTDGLLPAGWLWSAQLLYWPVLLWAVYRAPWSRLRDNEQSHVWLGTTVAIMLLWTMKAGFAEGMQLHLLGATLLVLMFGWQLAIVSTSFLVAGVALSEGSAWQVFAMNALLLGVVPVTVSHGIYRLADRCLPNHFFIYIFLCAFFGGAIAIGAVGLVSAGVLGLSGAYSLEYINYNYLSYFPLIMFPEAFITGMLTTLFVVYYPAWVSTFDDGRYLRNR